MVRHLTPLAFIFITCVIGFSEILASMMRRETGSKTLRSERVLSRGDPNFNGTAMVSVMTPGMNPPKRQQDYLVESLIPRFIILELIIMANECKERRKEKLVQSQVNSNIHLKIVKTVNSLIPKSD